MISKTETNDNVDVDCRTKPITTSGVTHGKKAPSTINHQPIISDCEFIEQSILERIRLYKSQHNFDRTMAKSHKSVVLFYRYFIPAKCPRLFSENASWFVDRIEAFQRKLCSELGCKGRILLATEGINGTLSGADDAVIQKYIERMKEFHLLNECGLPDGCSDVEANFDDIKNFLFEDVDWKQSTVEDGMTEPFPDLKISIVKEIVSTGGQVPVDEIPRRTGKHLSPREFHDALKGGEKPVVLIDVRNTFEHEIGHFVSPKTGEAALNPEMVTFSSFDSNFCSKHADEFKGKKVLMYCTGGIRCEKASVMLRKRGVEDVSQLKGGIHRYLEEFGNNGYFQGLNFVFDQRVAMKPEPSKPSKVVGRCVECDEKFDELSGSRICTVCRDLVLVCSNCQTKLREYHCRRHSPWKQSYFTFLEVFTANELKYQLERLKEIRDTLVPASGHKNQRRTLSRKIEKVSNRISKLEDGSVQAEPNAPRRCRTCMEPRTVCHGRCWGFWKTAAKDGEAVSGEKRKEPSSEKTEEILPIAVGDIVEPGDHWNPLRLGETTDSLGNTRQGKVTEIKSWTNKDSRGCVSVLWSDGVPRGRNQAKLQPQIYRWGVLALDGTRMYDVRKVETAEAQPIRQ